MSACFTLPSAHALWTPLALASQALRAEQFADMVGAAMAARPVRTDLLDVAKARRRVAGPEPIAIRP